MLDPTTRLSKRCCNRESSGASSSLRAPGGNLLGDVAVPPSPRRASSEWRSYDSVADIYEQAAVPRFLPLARDLVAAVSPSTDDTVLDLGTGTGLVARVTLEAVGATALVVGVDTSVGMLERA
jgi:SAM-dependent methyltransferase